MVVIVSWRDKEGVKDIRGEEAEKERVFEKFTRVRKLECAC
jgi:hypothetical protein